MIKVVIHFFYFTIEMLRMNEWSFHEIMVGVNLWEMSLTIVSLEWRLYFHSILAYQTCYGSIRLKEFQRGLRWYCFDIMTIAMFNIIIDPISSIFVIKNYYNIITHIYNKIYNTINNVFISKTHDILWLWLIFFRYFIIRTILYNKQPLYLVGFNHLHFRLKIQ